MKKYKLSLQPRLVNILLLSIFLITVSCSKNDEVDCTAIENQLEDAFDDYLDANEDFVKDDSSSNCKKLANATQKLVDQLKRVGSCKDLAEEIEDDFGDDLDELIDQLEEEIDDLDC